MKKLESIRLTLYIFLFVGFAFIPLDLIAHESFCVWYNVFHVLCPTCGFTRGFTAFMDGHVHTAFQYNEVLVLFFIPITIFVMFQDLYTIIYRKKTKENRVSLFEFLFILVFRLF